MSSPAASSQPIVDSRTSDKHPKGLAPLFFTEMWERLAFYLMVGILLLYAKDTERGGLGMSVAHAAEVYGTYLAFVYFTPFLGGMIADRYLGYRLAVLIGGLLMATGFFILGVRSEATFYTGLTLLCFGNGLFKPNITAMVGNLYTPGDPKRDAGFNIFYMGINIGAALSALLSAPLRNEWNFNVAFVGAGVGLLIGVLNLLWNWKNLAPADRRPEIDPRDVGLGQVALTILLPAAIFGVIGYYTGGRIEIVKNTLGPITFAFLVGMLPIGFYFLMLVLRATPDEKPGLAALIPVYLAGGMFFMILHLNGGLMTLFAENNTNRQGAWVPDPLEKYYCQKAMPSYFGNADPDLPRPPENALVMVTGEVEAMFGARRISDAAIAQIEQTHPDVKAYTGSDATAAGVPSDRFEDWKFLTVGVYPPEQLKVETGKDSHGVVTTSVKVVPETAKPQRSVILLRDAGGQKFPVLLVQASTQESVYRKAAPDSRLAQGAFLSLINAELLTSFLNPIFVVALTPLVVMYFSRRVRAGNPMSTARKILYGMLITFVSLLFMAAAAYSGRDGESKVSGLWIVAFYAILTVGELFLSPMGLSLVTKLSPKRLVGLMLGGWFLASAVGNKLSGFISGLEPSTMMFVVLSVAVFAVAMIILALQPMLNRAIKKYGA